MRPLNVQLRVEQLNSRIEVLNDLAKKYLSTEAQKIYFAYQVKQLKQTSKDLSTLPVLSDAFVIEYATTLEQFISILSTDSTKPHYRLESTIEHAKYSIDSFTKNHRKPNSTLIDVTSTVVGLAIILSPIALAILFSPAFAWLLLVTYFIGSAESDYMYKHLAVKKEAEYEAADSIGLITNSMYGLFSGKLAVSETTTKVDEDAEELDKSLATPVYPAAM